MTRFTRAKGSKASNERLPNEGTPWHIMKQQLEEALQKEQTPQEKTKSARQLLKEKDDVYYPQSLGNVNADWAEFEGSKNKINAVKSGKVEKKPKDQQKKFKTAANKSISEQNGLSESTSVFKEDKDSGNKKQNKNIGSSENNTEDNSVKNQNNTEEKKRIVDSKDSGNKKQNKNIVRSENNTEDNSAKNHNNTEEKKQKIDSNPSQPKSKKRKNKATEVSNPASESTSNNEQKVIDNKSEDSNTKLSKRQKRNKKKQDQINEPQSTSTNIATFNVEGNDWNNAVDTGKRKKVEKIEDNRNQKLAGNDRPNNRGDKWSQFEFKNFRRFGENVPKKFQRKVAKSKDDRDYQRRKPENNVMKVTINGMDVEIVKYDGFPVKREDAERLKELRQKMVMKGIPKSEIDAAMKLERRKCEKVLARIRKQVCFHCRKAGHNLSECPELGKEEAGTGICFKCGSTEHTHFECKVTKSDDYRYAKCFICREQGHIAKQCPDNPKGMYPDGGGCKICGDVTHLKKDCPDLTKEKEETTITLDTIQDSNLESLDGGVMKKPQEKAPVKKIVKF